METIQKVETGVLTYEEAHDYGSTVEAVGHVEGVAESELTFAHKGGAGEQSATVDEVIKLCPVIGELAMREGRTVAREAAQSYSHVGSVRGQRRREKKALAIEQVQKKEQQAVKSADRMSRLERKTEATKSKDDYASEITILDINTIVRKVQAEVEVQDADEVISEPLQQSTAQRPEESDRIEVSVSVAEISVDDTMGAVRESYQPTQVNVDEQIVRELESPKSYNPILVVEKSVVSELTHETFEVDQGSPDTNENERLRAEQLRQLDELFALPAFGETAENEAVAISAEVIAEVDEDVPKPYDLDRLHDTMDTLLMVGLAQEEVGLLDVYEQEDEALVSSLELVEFLPIESVGAEVSPLEADLSEPEALVSERVRVLIADLQILLQPVEPFQEEVELSSAFDLGIDAADASTIDIVDEENLAVVMIERAEIPELTPEIESKVVEILEAMGYQQPQEILDRYVAEYGSQALLESLQQLFPVVNRMQHIADMEGFLEATSGQNASQLADDDEDTHKSLRRLGRLIWLLATQPRVAGRVGQAV